MNLEEILKNKENKILFLKAILLGIKYGRLDISHSQFYENNIENELHKLQDEKKNIEINYIQNIDNYDKIVHNFTKKNMELENFRSNIIKNINNLSYNNYNNNYVKINLLRNNLNNINKEIEINRNNIIKFIEIKKNMLEKEREKISKKKKDEQKEKELKDVKKQIDDEKHMKGMNTNSLQLPNKNKEEIYDNTSSSTNTLLDHKNSNKKRGLSLDETIEKLNNLIN